MADALSSASVVFFIGFIILVLSPLFREKSYRILLILFPFVFGVEFFLQSYLESNWKFLNSLFLSVLCFALALLHAKLIEIVKKKGWGV